MDADLWKSALMRIARLKNRLAKGLKCSGFVDKYTTVGLCIPGHGAAEVYSPEGHRHAEANPTCEIHKGCCTSHQNSRPKSFVRIYLPR